ncbi:hypothetical protein SNE35_01455 [Paucibacter sp. R3-3]|uniref:Uncharacterized protein n=1 Tax=Roseateles agri TaxID=3098619 RepID=A0ABU5DBP9_9BURK|nr:hypothetical protein [Paucibacter sp. R3-3]MDY0743148.1 hypothetical protein [Paucibacter sp. R3-3]
MVDSISLSSLVGGTTAAAPASASTSASSSTDLSPTEQAALQTDESVILSLDGTNVSSGPSSPLDLYRQLSQLGSQLDGSNDSSAIDQNSNWATLLKSQPGLASVAVQDTADQALLTQSLNAVA